MLTADQSIEPIRQYIVDHHLDGQSDLGPKTPLLEWGVIDSFALTDVLAFIEDEFEVEVPAEEITTGEPPRSRVHRCPRVPPGLAAGPGAPRAIESRDDAAARVCGAGDRERHDESRQRRAPTTDLVARCRGPASAARSA